MYLRLQHKAPFWVSICWISGRYTIDLKVIAVKCCWWRICRQLLVTSCIKRCKVMRYARGPQITRIQRDKNKQQSYGNFRGRTSSQCIVWVGFFYHVGKKKTSQKPTSQNLNIGNPKRKGLYSNHPSNEKNPGCLGYIGDYTTQLYRDFNKPL